MGRVRNETVKKTSRIIIEKYYPKLTQDFQTNKKSVPHSTFSFFLFFSYLRGCHHSIEKTSQHHCRVYHPPHEAVCPPTGIFHVFLSIAKGPVQGISLKMQEEEREKRMDIAPEVSQVDQAIADSGIEVCFAINGPYRCCVK